MTKVRRAVFDNRNTTILGISMILVAIGTAGSAMFDGDPNTAANWGVIVPELLAAIGFLVAGDGGQ